MILHVDMDAFFASVEMLDNSELAGKCVIVGGMSGRGVVSAASYEARRFGVHSAMPVYQARQKCPHGIFLKPRRSRYKELSLQVMEILYGFSPLVEPVSIDEAYLDASGCEALHGPPEVVGRKIKERVRTELGLTCTVGIAPLKFLAKIASDMEKPDGLTFISARSAPDFILGLPVEKVPGVGSSTRLQLKRMGISVLGDVRSFSEESLVRQLGKYGRRLSELARGIDHGRVEPVRPVKSVSSEHTLAADTTDNSRLRSCLLQQSEELGRQLRRKGLRAGTVILKIKHADFSLITRRKTLAQATRSSGSLYKAGCSLLQDYSPGRPVRLIGLGASDLVDASGPVQMSLFGEAEVSVSKWESVEHAVDAIAERFGADAVKKAGLFDGRKNSG
ncbi:MAG: DNA polymerase IV [Desulfosalsimonadaceae bacterium]